MQSRRVLAFAAALASVVAANAWAQGSVTDAARKRYEDATKSTNIEGVARSMASEDAEERLQGLRDLTSLEDEQGVDLLLQALGDQDLRVRAKAIDLCGDLRATAATPVLIQQLFMADTPEPVKRRILASLGKIGDPRAAGPISEFLQRDLDPAMRGIAIFALGEIGSGESLTPLNEIQRTDGNATLRRLASEASNKVRYHQQVLATEAKEPRVTFLEDENARQQQQQQ